MGDTAATLAGDGEGLVRPDAPAGSLAQVTATLEEDIVFGRLHPRERLIEEGLAERFGAKRHVVRQALVELERLGLVERIHHRGAVVREYTPEEVEQIHAVRQLLEGKAAALIPLPVPPGAMDRLEAMQRAHADAVSRDNRRDAFRINLVFHRTLFALCGNPFLVEAIDDFAQKSHAYRSSVTIAALRRSTEHHWQIVAALKTGDREALIALCRDHLVPAKDDYIAAYRARYCD